MKYSESRGVKTSQWFANEILKDLDINELGHGRYQTVTEMLASLSSQEDVAEVYRGMNFVPDSGFTGELKSGAVVDYAGPYLVDGVWGFQAEAGTPSAVVVPVDVAVGITNASGLSEARIDTVEIRPKQTEYNSESRQFKDPITGLVSSAIVKTRLEYEEEIQVLDGTEAVKGETKFTITPGSGIQNASMWAYVTDVYGKTHGFTVYFHYNSNGTAAELQANTQALAFVDVESADTAIQIADDIKAALENAAPELFDSITTTDNTGTADVDITFAVYGPQTAGDDDVLIDNSETTLGTVLQAPTKTAGWIKVAEVRVNTGDSGIVEDQIMTYQEAMIWTREAGITMPWHNQPESNGVIFEGTADETLAIGDPVGFAGEGYRKAQFGPSGSELVIESGAAMAGRVEAVDIGGGFFAIAYADDDDSDYVKVAIVEYASGVISLDVSPTTVSTTGGVVNGQVTISRLKDDGYFGVSWLINPGTPTVYTRVGHVSASAIVWDVSETNIFSNSDVSTVSSVQVKHKTIGIEVDGYVVFFGRNSTNGAFWSDRIEFTGSSIVQVGYWSDSSDGPGLYPPLSIYLRHNGTTAHYPALVQVDEDFSLGAIVPNVYLQIQRVEETAERAGASDSGATGSMYPVSTQPTAGDTSIPVAMVKIDEENFAMIINVNYNSQTEDNDGTYLLVCNFPRTTYGNDGADVIIAKHELGIGDPYLNSSNFGFPSLAYFPESQLLLVTYGAISDLDTMVLKWTGTSFDLISVVTIKDGDGGTTFVGTAQSPVIPIPDNPGLALAVWDEGEINAQLIQLPVFEGVAVSAATSGNPVKIQRSGTISKNDLVPGRDYLMEYDTGEMVLSGDTPAMVKVGRAISTKKLMLRG